MNTIYIEPAHERRPQFALWALGQDPPIQTASASGWNVPLDLYPDVPVEALEGAYVDGWLYDGPQAPQPPSGAAEEPLAAQGGAIPPEPARKARKRAARKSAAAQPPIQGSGYATAQLLGTSDDGQVSDSPDGQA